MDVLSYVIGVLIVLVGIIISTFRRVEDILLLARTTILDEFTNAYREFGGTIIAEAVQLEQLTMSIRRLKCLHNSSHWDLLKIKAIEYILDLTVRFMITIIFIVSISLAIGTFTIDANQPFLKILFTLIIPFILLITELLFLGWIIKQESYLKRTTSKYKNLEYQV